jgi:hypothetical protein
VSWNQVGTPGRVEGISSTVGALATDGTNLYAGGYFIAAGQTSAGYIARFDGNNWYPLGSGVAGQGSFVVNALLVNAIVIKGNNLYAGGTFTQAGGGPAAQIASWDGTNWHALGGGPGGLVAALAVQSNYLYAAGAPALSSSYGSPFFVRWDGSSWQNPMQFTAGSFFPILMSDTVIGMDAIAVLGTNIFLGGHFSFYQCDDTLQICTNCNNILRFDGTYCWVLGAGPDCGLNGNVVAMATLGTNLYVAGNFTTAGAVPVSRIAKWDGANWSDVGGGVVGRGNILALTAMGGNLYAGGSFTNLGGVAARALAKWDGTHWSALGSGLSASAMALLGTGNDLYVGGGFRVAGDKTSACIGRWNDQINFDRPQLINPARLTNGQFRVRLVGISGITNLIQASTNLSSWTPVLTNSTGIYDFTDAASTNFVRRFYRALLGQ